MIDTRDDKLSHIFHAFGLVRETSGKVDEWYLNKHDALDGVLGVDGVHHHKPQSGSMCCSQSTVSFHYVEGAECLALWKVLEVVHEATMTDAQIQSLMSDVWPMGRQNLGFYSHGLPHGMPDSWNGVVEVVRKIATSVDPQKTC